MKKLHTIFIGSLLAISSLPFSTHAQSAYDAYKYGNIQSRGTARSIGIGGAIGSVGGDASSVVVNPAGIGVYRSSEFTVTPAMQFGSMSSNYFNTTAKDHHSRFILGNLSYITTYRAEGSEYQNRKLKTLSLGLTYNRVADFNERSVFTGLNSESSIADIFSADAIHYGIDANIQPPLGYLGYNGFLLYDDLTSIPTHTILDQGGSLKQTNEKRVVGGINEFGITLGGNYDEKILFGLGFNVLNYKLIQNNRFIEEDATGNTHNDFDHLIYSEDLDTYGVGINFKAGAIFIPDPSFRIGLAIHTPTWSSFEDVADYNLLTHTEQLKYDTHQSNTNPVTNVTTDYPYEYNYQLRTPWRAVVSATALFGKNGFLTADYEYVDYASMKYSDASGWGVSQYFNEVNRIIKDVYRGGHIVRVGGEARFDQLYLRAGFGFHSNPFEKNVAYNGEQKHYSAGLGYRSGPLGVDLGYMLIQSNPVNYAYPLLASGVTTGIVTSDQYKNLVSLTLSYRF